jgi:hypothetical protein
MEGISESDKLLKHKGMNCRMNMTPTTLKLKSYRWQGNTLFRALVTDMAIRVNSKRSVKV